MKNKFDFAADCITVNGKTFPARYEVTAAAVAVQIGDQAQRARR